MEYPFIALLWTTNDPERIHLATLLITKIRESARWDQPVRRDGFTIFARKPRPRFLATYVLAQERGVILGAIFKEGSTTRLAPREISEDADFAATCQISRGEYLTARCWGAYIALLSDATTGDWCVLRDCSGTIPCYYVTVCGITIAFSDVRDIALLRDIHDPRGHHFSFHINWRYIAGFMTSSQMQIRETGLRDVHELLAGDCLDSHEGRLTVRSTWNPLPLAERDPRIHLEEACHELRETTRLCLEAWAGTQDFILHSLSGGFDSSLVLALLMQAPRRPDIICVNRYALGPAEDERRHARIAAQAAGAQLIEQPWALPELNDRCLELPLTTKPSLAHLVNGLDSPFYNQLCSTRPIDAIWTGQGGDHLFWAVKTALGTIDYVRQNGLRRELLTVLRDASTLTGRSLPHIVGHLFASMRGNAHSSDPFFVSVNLNPHTNFLSAEARIDELECYVRHPWTEASDSLPPGKRLQVILLAEVLNRHRPLYGLQDVQEFHPLLSQPLIELCLRIPIYQLLTGGKIRGLARVAFVNDLPPPVLRREQKGQTTHTTLGLFRRSVPFLKSLLIDGCLANQRLLDRKALKHVLSADAPIGPTTLCPLFACIAAEVWLQSWLKGSTSAEAAPSIEAVSSTTRSLAPSSPPGVAQPVTPTVVRRD